MGFCLCRRGIASDAQLGERRMVSYLPHNVKREADYQVTSVSNDTLLEKGAR